jgi:hypothetical protein
MSQVIVRHLGVSLRSLQRYHARGNTLRRVYPALGVESRWSTAALHAQANNEVQHARAWVDSLERECERLRGIVRAYEDAQAHPAANAPGYHLV